MGVRVNISQFIRKCFHLNKVSFKTLQKSILHSLKLGSFCHDTIIKMALFDYFHFEIMVVTITLQYDSNIRITWAVNMQHSLVHFAAMHKNRQRGSVFFYDLPWEILFDGNFIDEHLLTHSERSNAINFKLTFLFYFSLSVVLFHFSLSHNCIHMYALRDIEQ